MFRKQRSPFNRKHSSNGVLPSFPDECGAPAVNGALVSQFHTWLDQGCERIDSLPDDTIERPSRSAAKSAEMGLTATNEVVLTDIARRPYAWARLVVASRDDTPSAAMWGDGIVWLGLAHDSDVWVRAVTLLNTPEPPAELVTAIAGVDAFTLEKVEIAR